MRTALLIPEKVSPWTPPLHNALRDEFGADVYVVPDRGPLPDLALYDVIISRLKFRHLAAMDSLDWGSSTAFKVHWDEDGFWDGLWYDERRKGLWSENIPRLGFDVLAVTGARTQEYFAEKGLQTFLVHKGFASESFRDEQQSRERTLAMYGQDYPSRILARHRLSRAGVPLRQIDVPFEELPRALGSSLAALSCTLDANIRGNVQSGWLLRLFPAALIRTAAGPEPMLKFFESAACGCATFVDYAPDLEDLGFVDNVHAIFFRDIDELVDKALTYFDSPERLREIGARGAVLCAERHTWQNRAAELRRCITAAMA